MEQGINKSFFDAVRQAQAGGKPLERYIKAIRAKVGVSVIDPFTGLPKDIILAGENKDENIDEITITLWTELEREYFRRANKHLLERGYLVPYTEDIIEQISVNEISDDELIEALGKPFFAVKALLDKFTSSIPVERLLHLAEDMNKSVGVIKAITKRLSELQQTFPEPVEKIELEI